MAAPFPAASSPERPDIAQWTPCARSRSALSVDAPRPLYVPALNSRAKVSAIDAGSTRPAATIARQVASVSAVSSDTRQGPSGTSGSPVAGLPSWTLPMQSPAAPARRARRM